MRRRAVVIVAVLTAAALAAGYVVRNFAIDTDTAKMLPSDLPWRKLQARFDAAFPQQADRIAVVIDGVTPEATEEAAAVLAERMRQAPDLLRDIYRPGRGAFFQLNGLLYLPPDQLSDMMSQLLTAQPLLGTLAADPSIRGLAEALRLFGEGVARGEAPGVARGEAPGAARGAQSGTRGDAAPRGFQQALEVLVGALQDAASGNATGFSWRSLFSGGGIDPRELRQFILVRPVLDFSRLEPGAAATEAIRAMGRAVTQQVTREFALDPSRGVTIRLTGSVPLADEEFATLADRALLNAAITCIGIVLMLWFAVRSVWMIGAMLLTLVAGLAITAAFGLVVFKTYNLISVAFIALFVGLGIDFCIQFGVAFRARWAPGHDRAATVRESVSAVGSGLALAAGSTALGFLAFLPTQYRGVSQLGLIAGVGMLIAFALTLTFLPALLTVVPLPRTPLGAHHRAYANVDALVLRYRRHIVAVSAALALLSLVALPRLQFDFNPLHLRSADTEAMATLLDIGKDPMQTLNTLDALTPSIVEAERLSDRLSKLPEVSQTLTLTSFVPGNQGAKIEEVSDVAMLLDPTLDPPAIKPAPSDEETVHALTAATEVWKKLAQSGQGSLGPMAGRLADALTRLAQGAPAQRAAAERSLMAPLRLTLGSLRSALQPGPITLANLPSDLKSEWQAADGTVRVQIFPSGDPNDNATLQRFVAAVTAITSDVTGPPIAIQASRDTIVRAFIEAAIFAGVAICALLLITLRRVDHALLALIPLLLAALTVFGLCALVPIPLNFENIIALPLLLGIGVAFSIYFVMAWRAGRRDILQSSLAHAILFSALTTASAFGSLALSRHPGTASLGILLAISLGCILLSVLIVLPALLDFMRPPRPRRSGRRRRALKRFMQQLASR